jgi:F0F1-type ATP synthase membrane subunit b/b'
MEILIQLGANSSAFIQFLFFVISISFLTIFVFNPYFKANDERNKRTKGADAVAKEAGEEAKSLALIFQAKAREINETIKKIFDQKRTEGAALSGELLNQAKHFADKTAQEARVDIEKQKQGAKAQVKKISDEISAELKNKFEGGL